MVTRDNLNHKNSMSSLATAIILATKAHTGQVDKSGEPYILHPLSVMRRVAEAGWTASEYLITAVLHDVVEDTSLTFDDIERFLGLNIASYVDSVSRRDSESYNEFLFRAMDNWVGRIVKFHDIKDNMDPSRAFTNTSKGISLCQRYEKSIQEYKSRTVQGVNMYKLMENFRTIYEIYEKE